ncbi:MAG: pirin family protein [Verrucomicrobia bacterium]|nr:MAG: pirin family protein [Verrucomicrobiota bacterium]
METPSTQKSLHILPRVGLHWVGDGFPVHSLFGAASFTPTISPFLMLDYAGPAPFTPTTAKRGVGAHPHKGFETITIVYQGEVEHRDSVGNHGTIGPGDVQWMTAASGILHEEFHSRAFAKRGGVLEMVQLWVNLPTKDKKAPPGYQSLLKANIPVVPLENGGSAHIIAGKFEQTSGAAHTFTPINLWDLRLKASTSTLLNLPAGYTTALLVLHGSVDAGDGQTLGDATLALVESPNECLNIHAHSDTTLLALNGAPIKEPIAAQGPFVMNTDEELYQAMLEFQNGQMGQL